MSSRMFARRTSQEDIAAGADQVLVGMSLPSDTVIHDIRAKISFHGSSGVRAAGAFTAYAVEAWILPVLDPDAASPFNTIWDALVPKDTDVQTLDLDTAAGDATPFWEPGEADFGALFDVGLRPERLYHKHEFLTLMNTSGPVLQDAAAPTDAVWIPGRNLRIHVGRRLRVRQPSVLLIAMASPSGDDTTLTEEAALAENEWFQVKYIEHVIERAELSMFGLVETGAETPWEEASILLQKHLDPDVFEGTDGSFVSQAYFAVTELGVDHSVPGVREKRMITTGR